MGGEGGYFGGWWCGVRLTVKIFHWKFWQKRKIYIFIYIWGGGILGPALSMELITAMGIQMRPHITVLLTDIFCPRKWLLANSSRIQKKNRSLGFCGLAHSFSLFSQMLCWKHMRALTIPKHTGIHRAQHQTVIPIYFQCLLWTCCCYHFTSSIRTSLLLWAWQLSDPDVRPLEWMSPVESVGDHFPFLSFLNSSDVVVLCITPGLSTFRQFSCNCGELTHCDMFLMWERNKLHTKSLPLLLLRLFKLYWHE